MNAVPLPFGIAEKHALKQVLSDPCAVNGAPSKRYCIGFTSGLREVFTLAAAAFFHQPKALFRRTCKAT